MDKTVPTYFTDPEVDASTIAPGSEIWTQPSMDRPHWNEVLDALQEDVDFCEDGETTIARVGLIANLGFSTSPTMARRQLKKTRYRRYYCRLDQLSDILGTGLPEKSSTRHRRHEVPSVPDVGKNRDRV